jgi:hypothetical protein
MRENQLFNIIQQFPKHFHVMKLNRIVAMLLTFLGSIVLLALIPSETVRAGIISFPKFQIETGEILPLPQVTLTAQEQETLSALFGHTASPLSYLPIENLSVEDGSVKGFENYVVEGSALDQEIQKAKNIIDSVISTGLRVDAQLLMKQDDQGNVIKAGYVLVARNTFQRNSETVFENSLMYPRNSEDAIDHILVPLQTDSVGTTSVREVTEAYYQSLAAALQLDFPNVTPPPVGSWIMVQSVTLTDGTDRTLQVITGDTAVTFGRIVLSGGNANIRLSPRTNENNIVAQMGQFPDGLEAAWASEISANSDIQAQLTMLNTSDTPVNSEATKVTFGDGGNTWILVSLPAGIEINGQITTNTTYGWVAQEVVPTQTILASGPPTPEPFVLAEQPIDRPLDPGEQVQIVDGALHGFRVMIPSKWDNVEPKELRILTDLPQVNLKAISSMNNFQELIQELGYAASGAIIPGKSFFMGDYPVVYQVLEMNNYLDANGELQYKGTWFLGEKGATGTVANLFTFDVATNTYRVYTDTNNWTVSGPRVATAFDEFIAFLIQMHAQEYLWEHVIPGGIAINAEHFDWDRLYSAFPLAYETFNIEVTD